MQFENLKNLTGRQLHTVRLDAAHMHAAKYRAAIEREYEQRCERAHRWNPVVYGERC